jgi:hypothetical protein
MILTRLCRGPGSGTRAQLREHGRAVAKFTEAVITDTGSNAGLASAVQFREDPPMQVHLESAGHEMEEVLETFESYRASLSDDLRVLAGRYRIADVVRHVVGVGSVGTLVWVCLLKGPSGRADDRIVLQVKQAQDSVLESHLPPSTLGHAGRRVVAGQRLTQGPTDIFLGWCVGPCSGRHYYVRQLWDRKGRSDLTTLNRRGLQEHATLCAWALARVHARSGAATVISGYLGRSDVFDKAIATYAETYADCTARDHAALLEAIADGRLQSSDVI